MGVIRKQGSWSLILTYAGFAIGAVNIFILYPRLLSQEEFGLSRLIMTIAGTLSHFAVLSFTTSIYKFSPFYKAHLTPKKNDLLTISLVLPTLGFVAVTLVTLLFQHKFIEFYSTKSKLLVEYIFWIYPYTLFISYFVILKTHVHTFHNNILPTIIEEITFKLYIILLMVLYYFKLINFHYIIIGISFFYMIACIPLLRFLHSKNALHITFTLSNVTRKLKKFIIGYSGYIYLGIIVIALSEAIAPLLITGYNGLGDAAIFVVALYFAQILDVPKRSIYGVSIAIMAEAWRTNDLKKIDLLYKRTALNLLIACGFIFGFMWVNIDSIIGLLPENYAKIKYIILILGISKLIDTATGMNEEILNTSNAWKFNFTTQVLLILINIPLSVLFIKSYGLIGIAFATLIATIIYNGVRFGYILYWFKLQPFSKAIAGVFIIIAMLLFGLQFITISNPYLSILVKSMLYALSFIFLLFKLQLSPDVADFYYQIKNRLRRVINSK